MSDNFTFHLAADCPDCGQMLVDEGVSMTLLVNERTGLPVIPIDMFASESFSCRACKVTAHFGDLEPYVEDDSEDDGEAGESDD